MSSIPIQHLPSAWREQLRQAAGILDMDSVYQLIEEIRPLDSSAADTLTHLAQNFEYEKIVTLTEGEAVT